MANISSVTEWIKRPFKKGRSSHRHILKLFNTDLNWAYVNHKGNTETVNALRLIGIWTSLRKVFLTVEPSKISNPYKSIGNDGNAFILNAYIIYRLYYIALSVQPILEHWPSFGKPWRFGKKIWYKTNRRPTIIILSKYFW